MARVVDVAVHWREDLVFDAAAPGRAPILVDGNSRAAISPVELLAASAATCTAADVVEILKKMRIPIERVDVAAHGTRRDAEPRRLTALQFRWTIAGAGIDDAKARRAIELSIEKYCSVVASLAPDIAITYELTLA